MEYVSTSEIAKIWDISRRRVTTLCREGRVEGAVFAANTWLVPIDAKKRKIQEKFGTRNNICKRRILNGD